MHLNDTFSLVNDSFFVLGISANLASFCVLDNADPVLC